MKDGGWHFHVTGGWGMNPDWWNPEAWLQVLQDRWLVVVVAVAAILLGLKLVKTVLKWVLVIAIAAGVLTYGGYSVSDLTATLKREAITVMAGEAGEARYRLRDDGTFEVTGPNLKLTGVPNAGEVEVTYRGIPLGTWKLEGAIREFVERARSSAQ